LSKHSHNFVGPVFIVSLLMFIVMFLKDNLPRLYDIKWFVKLGGMISGEHVPSGRFNAGEKVWFWSGVVVLSLIVSASGLVLLFPNFDQVRAVMIEANVVHMVSGGAVLAISLGHIYLGTIGLDGAYESMRNGYVDETWAREHQEYWYNDVKSGKVKAGTAMGQPGAPQAQHLGGRHEFSHSDDEHRDGSDCRRSLGEAARCSGRSGQGRGSQGES